jgi:hypothetical protein
MERKALVIKARRHWEEWLPEKTQDLKEAGEFKAATRARSKARAGGNRRSDGAGASATRGGRSGSAEAHSFGTGIAVRPILGAQMPLAA